MFRGLFGALAGRLGAKLLAAALVGVLVLVLANLSFEVSMIGTGALAFIQAYMTQGVNSLLKWAAMLVIFGIIGCWFSRKIGGAVVFVGILVLAFALIVLQIRGAFPYGQDSPARIAALWATLKGSATIPDYLSQVTGGKDAAFLSAPIAVQGHRYLALNRLGCSPSTPDSLIMKIEADINPAFPILVRGVHGNSVSAGNTLYLGILPGIGGNPVTCRLINGHCFALDAQPGHWLEGTAYHGIVRDRSGDLWLFQYGAYEAGDGKEPDVNQLANYPIADRMWHRMAENITNVFADDFPAGCRPKKSGGAGGGSGLGGVKGGGGSFGGGAKGGW